MHVQELLFASASWQLRVAFCRALVLESSKTQEHFADKIIQQVRSRSSEVLRSVFESFTFIVWQFFRFYRFYPFQFSFVSLLSVAV